MACQCFTLGGKWPFVILYPRHHPLLYPHLTVVTTTITFLSVERLDQSYFSDALYASPSDAALEADIASAKLFGFNAIRGHQKYGSAFLTKRATQA